ncbi:MAG TPA: hypothetical protein P5534_17925 [Candidatus Paceibacterota bacterium]|nr:hypothetical protein [Candidatus Paceibacterota bacterium]HRZ56646.1 hypothetical protein [Candidatus Paceibacterota bacterium]
MRISPLILAAAALLAAAANAKSITPTTMAYYDWTACSAPAPGRGST